MPWGGGAATPRYVVRLAGMANERERERERKEDMRRRRLATVPSVAPALPSSRGVQKRVKRAARGRKKSPPPSPPSVVPLPAPPSPQPPQRSSSSLTHCEQRAGVQRCSPRKRAREEDANDSSLGPAARRARLDPEAAPQLPAAPQPQRETSSDDGNSSTTITKPGAEEEARVAAEGASLVSSAAPPTKRGFLRHFETALLHSTSAALTAEKEKVVDTLTAAGESGLSNAHGVFLAQHCAHATREECAFVDGRLRLWFAAGTGGDFKELFDTLEEHGKLTLSEALARCAQPPPPPRDDQPCPAPSPTDGSHALHIHGREERAANEPFGQDWCEICVPLTILNTLRRMKVLPAGGCIVCDTSDVSVGGRVLPCSHRCAHALARVASRGAAPRRVDDRLTRCSPCCTRAGYAAAASQSCPRRQCSPTGARCRAARCAAARAQRPRGGTRRRRRAPRCWRARSRCARKPGPAAMRGLYDMNSALMTGVVGEPRFAAVEAQCYQALP